MLERVGVRDMLRWLEAHGEAGSPGSATGRWETRCLQLQDAVFRNFNEAGYFPAKAAEME